ncbi:MAG: DUF255 domain-containing protein [Bacteroidetes bacterium]|nr:DUF255 domain-containing protein [Bacteroidota bacterium]
MKRLLVIVMTVLCVADFSYAGDKNKKATPKKAETKVASAPATELEWLSIEEAEKRMKTTPKKVWIDVYTNWCGWCKVMDKKTFTNPDVIKYMNAKFYAVKLNAESRDSMQYKDKKWGFTDGNRANDLAMTLLNGQLSYPTSIIMTEDFNNPSALPGYLTVTQVESIVKYLGEETYKTTSWEEYQKTFKPSWQDAPPPSEADFKH